VDNYRNFAGSLALGVHNFLHARWAAPYPAGDCDSLDCRTPATRSQDYVINR